MALGVLFGAGVISGVGAGVTTGSTVGAVSIINVVSASVFFAHPDVIIPIIASISAAARLQNVFIIAKV